MEIEPTMTTIERAILLMEVHPLQYLTSDEIATLAAHMTEVRFEAGEILAEGRDPESHGYFVVSGVLEYLSGDVVVRRATRGMAVGLFGLLGIEDTGLTLRADEDTHALAFTREEFTEFITDSPAASLGVVRALAEVILKQMQHLQALGVQAVLEPDPPSSETTEKPST
ncbi:MAG: cyclic nucleotide-binding domain-containing protein [Luteitalea sp.]|nr:cyclic nucleotide-binding domain-containing protein [Luteitalea sp.]